MKTTEFYFRGNRDYLHGTTLFDYILNTFVMKNYKPKNIDFSFHKLTNKQCLITHEEGALPHERLVAQYKDDKIQLYIYETKELIIQRFPYDEEGITKNCVIINDEVNIPEKIIGYSFIEKVITAFKFLLTTLYRNLYNGYLFARLIIKSIPEGAISIKQERIISNKFFEGKIKEGDKEIGSIFFVVVGR